MTPHTLAFGLIAEALARAKLEREQVDCLAVGLGPGSYTGIRVAISIAQGWQLARGVRLLGISSIEALALEAQKQGLCGTVHLVVDAHRNEFYLATYEIGDKDVSATIPLCLTSLADTQARAQTGGVLAGPDIQAWFPGSQPLFPHASMLGRLAAAREDCLRGEKLEPIYLRPTRFVKAAPPRMIPSV